MEGETVLELKGGVGGEDVLGGRGGGAGVEKKKNPGSKESIHRVSWTEGQKSYG